MNRKPTTYSTGIVVSVSLHALIIAIMAVGWTPEREAKRITLQYIEAKLLQMEPPKAPVSAPAKKPPENNQQQAAAQKQAEAKRNEQLRQERLRQEKLAQEKLAKERLAQEKLAKEKKAREEQLKKDQLRREKEQAEARKRKEEDARKAREDARKREQELAFAEALKNEESFRNAAADEQATGSYSAYISDRIANQWSRPPSARRGMEVTLIIQMAPTGRVVSVAVEKSSGNNAFDRSAEQAVHKVERFERLQELSKSNPRLFESSFRRFRLVFRPDDLRL